MFPHQYLEEASLFPIQAPATEPETEDEHIFSQLPVLLTKHK
jgi:hypothetical protein